MQWRTLQTILHYVGLRYGFGITPNRDEEAALVVAAAFKQFSKLEGIPKVEKVTILQLLVIAVLKYQYHRICRCNCGLCSYFDQAHGVLFVNFPACLGSFKAI